MRCRLVPLLVSAFACVFPASAQVRVEEEFAAGDLNWNEWCPCQIDMENAPVTFPDDPDQAGDRIARIVVDDASLGGNVCRSDPPENECRPPGAPPAVALLAAADEPTDSPEPLGPSLIGPDAPPPPGPGAALMAAPRGNPHCTDEIERGARRRGEEDECIQRQELRLQRKHAAAVPHLYSLWFRMPAVIEDRENSIRWVTAQWKQEPVSEAYRDRFGADWGPSPFLAQRFDDGVLHVTVQDEHCRCIVASAPYPGAPVRADGPARDCRSTEPGASEGLACTADLRLEYGEKPHLSPALGEWTEMRYRVQAGRARDAVIEVYEGDRFIVRVTGKIGYETDPGEVPATKFKIGHYRDYMPYAHAMEIDWVNVAPASK